jgi:hypothetical protein
MYAIRLANPPALSTELIVPLFTKNNMETVNRPDEWKIEQGLSGAKLPFLDQTGSETVAIAPHKWEGFSKDEAAIKAVGDPDELFVRELEGWKGYVLIYRIGVFS